MSIYKDIDIEFKNNKNINILETQERKLLLKSKPINLMVILTTQCNITCIMCPRARERITTLPFELVKQRIYKLFPYLEWLDWQGGEVFLLDYFKEIFLEAAKYPNIKQHITTNGLLVDSEWARLISEHNVDLLYSIDGVMQETYEFIRYGAKFENLIRSIELINKFREKYNSRLKLVLNAIVMGCNYKELYMFPDFCRKYNFNGLRFGYLVYDSLPEQDIITGKRNPDIFNYLKTVLCDVRNKCKVYNIKFSCTFERLLDFQQSAEKSKENPSFDEKQINSVITCTFPWTTLFIYANAQVYPKCGCDLSVGNLENDDLFDIWNGDTMQLYRNLSYNNRLDEICSKRCLI